VFHGLEVAEFIQVDLRVSNPKPPVLETLWQFQLLVRNYVQQLVLALREVAQLSLGFSLRGLLHASFRFAPKCSTTWFCARTSIIFAGRSVSELNIDPLSPSMP
jgi:hypothetical protein